MVGDENNMSFMIWLLFLKSLGYFFQSQEVSSHVTARGTHGCIRCGKMETPDSGTVGPVRLVSSFSKKKPKTEKL